MNVQSHLVLIMYFHTQHWLKKWNLQYSYLLLFTISIFLWTNRTDLSAIFKDIFHTELKFDESGCPMFPIATFPEIGLLGNQISSYANFIALQWLFGYQLYLEEDFKKKIQLVFKNVTFPTIESIEHCKIDGWYSVAPLMENGKFNRQRDEIGILIENIIHCEKKDQACLPAESGKILNIYIRHSHNVKAPFAFFLIHPPQHIRLYLMTKFIFAS